MFRYFRAVEEVHDDGTPTTKTFEHVPSEIGAEEAEEVGVEHLLRDIKDTTVGTLSQKITNQLMGLKGLEMKLKDMHTYLQQVNNLTAHKSKFTNSLFITGGRRKIANESPNFLSVTRHF